MDAFDFEFFRQLYEDLDSPVLANEDADCQFFAWDFEEFANMQQGSGIHTQKPLLMLASYIVTVT